MTLEGRPTGAVPWDWLAYFHQRRPDCGVEYHDPRTKAHPVIPRGAVRVVRTKREREEESPDGPQHGHLRRRAIEVGLYKLKSLDP